MDDLTITLNKAKIALMSKPDSAFFTTVCFSLKHSWDSTIPTACTDGLEIKFNPNFWLKLTQEERIGLMLHETLHVAYMHMARLNDRDPKRWNIAGDHVINLQLLDRGFKIPEGGYADKAYAGMSTEQVYDHIKEVPSNFQLDISAPPKDMSDDDLVEQIQDILVQASIQSRIAEDKPGSIPGEIEIFLSKLLKPKLPWYRILRRFFEAHVKRDYTFKKPNRRFFPQYHLPSLYSENIIDFAVAIDVSGSISHKDFMHFITEVAAMLRSLKPENLTLIQFDYILQSIDILKDVSELEKVKFKGRGGTDISHLLDWAEERKPRLLLIFTDGDFNMPRQKFTSSSVVWLIHTNKGFTAPFGKVINYSLEK